MLPSALTICSAFAASRLGLVPISNPTPLHSSGIVDTPYSSQYSKIQVFLKGDLISPLSRVVIEVLPFLIPQA